MGCRYCECLENPVGGNNRKIGAGKKVSFDTSAGPPSVGGTCIATTGGCKYCYAQAQQKVMASAGGTAAANATLAQVNPEKYAAIAIEEIAAEQARRTRQRQRGKHVEPYRLIRIHGFGDFFSTRHLRAWIRIVRAFPRIKFFGTTRTWQLMQGKGEAWLMPGKPGYVPDRRAFIQALEELRSEPNVFLGASIDESTRNAMAPDHLTSGQRMTKVEWLRSTGWNIWNALTDYGDPDVRKADGKVPVIRYDPHSKKPESAKKARAAARLQGRVAAETGKLLGPICYEQTGQVKNCTTCMYCAQKGIMVTFACHTGHSKKETPARTKAFDTGYISNMNAYGLEVPVGPGGATMLVTPLSMAPMPPTNLIPASRQLQVAENPRRRAAPPEDMFLLLEHGPNRDITTGAGYWQSPATTGVLRRTPVDSLEDASRKFRHWIEYEGLGAGNLTRQAGTVVRGDRVLGRISYNGRIWLPDGTEYSGGPRTNPHTVSSSGIDYTPGKLVSLRCYANFNASLYMSPDYVQGVANDFLPDLLKKLNQTAIVDPGLTHMIVRGFVEGRNQAMTITFSCAFQASNFGSNRDRLEQKCARAFNDFMKNLIARIESETRWKDLTYTGSVEAR